MAAHYFPGSTISKRYTTLRDATLESLRRIWRLPCRLDARPTGELIPAPTPFFFLRKAITSSQELLLPRRHTSPVVGGGEFEAMLRHLLMNPADVRHGASIAEVIAIYSVNAQP